MDDLLECLQESLELEQQIAADTPLLSSGLVDSFSMVALLSVLESRYGVDIDPEEIDVTTFDTPNQILARIGGTAGR